MTDNMRVALHGAEHEVLATGRPHGPARPVTVVGKHCESGDIPADMMQLDVWPSRQEDS